MRYASITALLAVAVVSILVGAGCDDTVTAVLESDKQITMFATLDMNSDTQYVRIIPIRETINEVVDPTRYAVKSIDLDNGTEVQWRDSLITFANGKQGLIFLARLRLFPGHTYRLEATGGDSPLVTSAETRIPPVPSIVVNEETAERRITSTGFFVVSSQSLRWTGLERAPFRVDHWYRFLRTPRSAFDDIQFPFPPITNVSGGELALTINLAADKVALEDSIDVNSTAFVGLGMRITILDTKFVPPGGVFDPEVLVQPGTFSNVENGFGFVGAVGRFSAEWVLKESSLHILGYLPVWDAFGKTEADRILEVARDDDLVTSIR